LSVFAAPAVRETVKIILDIEKEHFHFSGSRFIEDGWREFYKPYSEKKEETSPKLIVGQTVSEKSKFHSKKTVPPKRYTLATIIKELEKRNLGTKSTRAQVIDTLAQRGYISGTSIEVTKLGQELINAFSKYAPDILSEQLTRHFEDEMEQIQERKKKKEYVFHEAKKILIDLLNKFNLHALEIGKELSEAVAESKRAETVLMKCPKCGVGDFRIIISKATRKRFLACNKYPDCKTAWPLPQQGLLKFLDEKHSCGIPMIAIIKRGSKPWKLCPNPNCPEKQTAAASGNPQASAQAKPEGKA
jgi:DNA topoisomerase-1